VHYGVSLIRFECHCKRYYLQIMLHSAFRLLDCNPFMLHITWFTLYATYRNHRYITLCFSVLNSVSLFTLVSINCAEKLAFENSDSLSQ
jgi:hypothetical protein